MKMKILSLILIFVSVFTKAQTQVTNCLKEDFNLPTNGWKYSQGASEGTFDNPLNSCIEDRGIITPGVGGNNPANITTPLITSVNPKTIEVSFDIFVLDANLKCQTWKDYPCLTSVDIYYHVGTNTYIGIKDLVMPNNGPGNSSKVNIIFNSNIPSGTQFTIEIVFKPKSGIGNCVQQNTKYVIDNISICQNQCNINRRFCTPTNTISKNINTDVINNCFVTGTKYSLFDGPYVNGDSAVSNSFILTLDSTGNFVATGVIFAYKAYSTNTTYYAIVNIDMNNQACRVLSYNRVLFSLSTASRHVVLVWKVDNENELERFEVQGMENGRFRTLEIIPAGINSTHTLIVNNNKIGQYRILCVSKSNEKFYSDIKVVKTNIINSEIYPNPSSGQINVSMNTNLEISNHNSNIFVYSTNGNLVLTKKVDGFVVIDGLKKGTYIIKIVNQDDIIVKKLIIE